MLEAREERGPWEDQIMLERELRLLIENSSDEDVNETRPKVIVEMIKSFSGLQKMAKDNRSKR